MSTLLKYESVITIRKFGACNLFVLHNMKYDIKVGDAVLYHFYQIQGYFLDLNPIFVRPYCFDAQVYLGKLLNSHKAFVTIKVFGTPNQIETLFWLITKTITSNLQVNAHEYQKVTILIRRNVSLITGISILYSQRFLLN